jgi:muramoyltetrapeptide carboxypeptidase
MPPLLAPGARVALVAPAGPLRGEEDLQRATHNARRLGWEPVVGAHALAREGFFAGSDAERLDDFNHALRDRRIDGIWCLRGGYGAMRILAGIDYGALASRPKAVVGYSDVTALHCAIAACASVGTYHGPTARTQLTTFTTESLGRATGSGEDPCGLAENARTLRSGRAAGRLTGGNLALLSALAGTAYAPRFDDAIVVLEDINEATYRIDRMLRQLLLAGAFAGCRGIAFGECTGCAEEADVGARSLDEVVGEVADLLRVPCLTGIPLGHIDDQWTIPLGATGELDADARSLHVAPGQPVA